MRKRRNGKGILFIIVFMLFMIILFQRIKIDHILNSTIETEETSDTKTTESLKKAEETSESDETEKTSEVSENTETSGNDTKETSIFDVFGTKAWKEKEFLLEDDSIEQQTLAIVAKQISPSAHKEAILAQCVIARTSLYDAKENNAAEPESMSVDDMMSFWGEEFEKYYHLLEECVMETRGEVLTWNGEYIYAAYHAVSAGTTRNISELYESVNMPYLKEVTCPDDAVADGYLSVLYWEKNEFFDMCSQLTENEKPTSLEQIQILKRDLADYVLEIQVGSQTFSGEEFRSRLGINSACFTITELGDNVRVVTKGIGHGFGLSQHTAEKMAESGNTYREILETFYPNTTLEKKKES